MRFIDEHAARTTGGRRWGVASICAQLAELGAAIAPSTYYVARTAAPTSRQLRDRELGEQIERVHAENYGVYGARKVWAQLNREGIEVARCTVERLMRERGLVGVRRGRKVRTTVAGGGPRVADLVGRRFDRPVPDRLWVADFTYVPTWSGMVYVAFVIDAYSGALSIRTLTEMMNVSHMTVRRDIAALEEAGQVVAVQGGVRLADVAGHPPRHRAGRAMLQLPRKRAIAERAAAMVEDGMTVFLDAGTTCESVVSHLATHADLTVVTNDFFTARAMFDLPGIDAIHTGGRIDPDSGSATGPLAATTLASIVVDVCFLSTGAWDLDRGLTTPSTDQVVLKRAAMAACSRTVLLADSTKYAARERFHVVGLTDLDGIVTDEDLPARAAEHLDERGVELHRVPHHLSP